MISAQPSGCTALIHSLKNKQQIIIIVHTLHALSLHYFETINVYSSHSGLGGLGGGGGGGDRVKVKVQMLHCRAFMAAKFPITGR